jgi:hypothetical protein
MPGVPGIHVLLAAPKTWMAGTSLAMTENFHRTLPRAATGNTVSTLPFRTP